jgi:hypothetical protein
VDEGDALRITLAGERRRLGALARYAIDTPDTDAAVAAGA